MFARLGAWSIRFRYLVIGIWAVLILAALPVLPNVESPLRVGGFGTSDSEGTRTQALLVRELDFSPSSMVLVYTSETLAGSSEKFQDQVLASVDGVRTLPFVTDIVTPDLDGSLIAASDRTAYAVVGVNLPAEEAQNVVAEFNGALVQQPDLRVISAGGPVFYADIETASQRDLRRAELFALPIALVALLIVFGTVVAAIVPLIVGCAGVAVILLTIFTVAHITDISIFALNLATMLGLGLAVDYSLFVTSRFREEIRANGGDTNRAVVVAVARAGRAVFFSGLTVLVGLSGLILFPIMFLRSIGIAGVIVVAVSTIAANTLLPAVLAIIGPRIESMPLGRLANASRETGSEHGFWRQLAHGVMRHPVTVAIGTLIVLVSLGLPFVNANISSPDATILPGDLPSRQGFDILAREFSGGEISPFVIAIETNTAIREPRNLGMVNSLVRRLEADPRINRVQSAVTFPGLTAGENPGAVILTRQLLGLAGVETRLQSFIGDKVTVVIAYPTAAANADENKNLLADLRRIDVGPGANILVGGGTAAIVDTVDSIYRDFPKAALLILGTTYLILLLLFRSVIIPLKAILVNILSILASYGALVWIFQEGHFHRILQFTPQGFVEASLPVVMFCVLFGLSMDYEVFLLSRVQEEYERSGDNEHSVAVGLQRSGKIISSAALIVVVVTASFVTADVVLVKALGFGIALAVALDATIVRALLVPATMKLLGNANWWLPKWLDRLLPRAGHVEH